VSASGQRRVPDYPPRSFRGWYFSPPLLRDRSVTRGSVSAWPGRPRPSTPLAPGPPCECSTVWPTSIGYRTAGRSAPRVHRRLVTPVSASSFLELGRCIRFVHDNVGHPRQCREPSWRDDGLRTGPASRRGWMGAGPRKGAQRGRPCNSEVAFGALAWQRVSPHTAVEQGGRGIALVGDWGVQT
jgi:hypothetical protein